MQVPYLNHSRSSAIISSLSSNRPKQHPPNLTHDMTNKHPDVPEPNVEIVNGTHLIKCPYPGCDSEVKKMWNYYSHARTHTNHRPYGCPFCKAAFKWQSSLKAHLNHHENRHRRAVASSGRSPSRSREARRSGKKEALPPVQTLLRLHHGAVDPAALMHPALPHQTLTPLLLPSPTSILPSNARRGHAAVGQARDEHSALLRKKQPVWNGKVNATWTPSRSRESF